MENESTTLALCRRAKAASRQLIGVDENTVNCALTAMAEALISHSEAILAANAEDLAAADGVISTVM